LIFLVVTILAFWNFGSPYSDEAEATGHSDVTEGDPGGQGPQRSAGFELPTIGRAIR
jgi:hypothetical protein